MANKKWTYHEEAFVRDYAGKITDEKLAEEISKFSGRSISAAAVRKKRQLMGLSKIRGRGKCALESEVADDYLATHGLGIKSPNGI